jgi:iron complex transport system substrate-binding protein
MTFSRRTALTLLALGFASACGHKALPTHSRAEVRRIVSLTPNTTEALFAIGAGALVVGRSRYCDWPPEVRALPAVGGYVDASYEAILALRPDLVVGARGPAGAALAERLLRRDIEIYFPITETIAGIEEMIDGLGKKLGRVGASNEVAARIEAHLAATQAKVRDLPKPRCLLVFGLSPIVAAAPGSFADEMLVRAGATNVLTSGTHYPTIGMETVLGLKPEVIIDAAVAEGHGVERIGPDRAGWSEVEAVRRGAVIAVDDNAVLRPGPRVAEGVERLATLLHPKELAP